jgi:hypothetical protein
MKIKVKGKGQITYPPGHKLGMVVPQGGSNCKKCEYVQGQACTNKIFTKWLGSNTIPSPIDSYCCDLFETK